MAFQVGENLDNHWCHLLQAHVSARRLGDVLFVLGVHLDDEFTHLVLRLRVIDRPKQGEVGPVAVYVERARGEGDGTPFLPSRRRQMAKSDSASAHPTAPPSEMQFGIRELAGRCLAFVAKNLHCDRSGGLRRLGPSC